MPSLPQVPPPLDFAAKEERSRWTFILPHVGQTWTTAGSTRWTNTSNTCPQSRHWYSKRGNALTSLFDVLMTPAFRQISAIGRCSSVEVHLENYNRPRPYPKWGSCILEISYIVHDTISA